jgi:hypothetical protein
MEHLFEGEVSHQIGQVLRRKEKFEIPLEGLSNNG